MSRAPDAIDTEIDRLMAGGYDWHSAYFVALIAQHRRDFEASSDMLAIVAGRSEG